MKKITFDPDLNPKHRLLAFLTLNNKALVVFFLNIYVKILSYLNLKNKSKYFHIKKINIRHYEVNTEEGIINTPTVYRTLNLSSGLEWRTRLLANSYGVDYFKDIFTKEGSVVIDIGANIGEFSLYCVKKKSKVFSIEPDKAVFPMLDLNVKNFVPDIQTFNMSISNNTGKQNLYYATLTGSTTIVEPNDRMNFTKFELEKFSSENKVYGETDGITLDDFINKNEINHIDLIKCDAEGAEPEIIKGLNQNAYKVKYITIDTVGERNGEDTTDEVIKLLKERKFNILKIPNKKMGRVVIAENKKYNQTII